MNDWKAGKLLKNCVQIAVAVLGCSSKAIPLHRKKQVRTGSSLMRSSSAIRGIRRDKKEVSTKDRKGNGALPECGNRLGYKSVRRDVPCKEKSRTDFSVLLLNYVQAATSSDWGYSSGCTSVSACGSSAWLASCFACSCTSRAVFFSTIRLWRFS